MAAPQLIDISNYDTLLVESTVGRAGSPDGNFYFDQANDLIEIITLEELATVNLGSGAEANPLTNSDGITMQAIYAFERLRRGVNTALRNFLPGVDGNYQYAGAYTFVNGVKLAADATSTTNNDDRYKIRGSGVSELANDGNVDRIYFGVRSLNNIEAASQPFYQLAVSESDSDLQAAAPVDFYRTGPINEMIQVFGDTGNGDASAGDFDYTDRVLVIGVREFGRTQGRATSTATGIATLQGFSAGFGIGEAASPVSVYDLADVIGGAAVTPWDTMTYEHFGTPQTRTGFNGGDADFSDIISNPDGGSLLQLRAYMDALMLQDTDQDAGAGTFYPKRAKVLYTINADGQIVTRQGLHIDNVPVGDQQGIIQTADDGTEKSYPFYPEIRIRVSDAWANDPNAWGQLFFANGAGGADFDTANAVIVNDANGDPIVVTSADVTGVAGSYEIVTSFDYDNNTQAGLSAGVDKDVVFLAEGYGVAQASNTAFTIVRQAVINASALAESETNI